MRNFFRLLGIIALVAVIGFSMAACDNGGGGSGTGGGGTGGGDSGGTAGKVTVIVKNNFNKPITKVKFADNYLGVDSGYNYHTFDSLNITTGGSQTFTFSLIDDPDGIDNWCLLYAEGLTKLNSNTSWITDSNCNGEEVWYVVGKTTTVTLGSDGKITKVNPAGFY